MTQQIHDRLGLSEAALQSSTALGPFKFYVVLFAIGWMESRQGTGKVSIQVGEEKQNLCSKSLTRKKLAKTSSLSCLV